MIQGTRLLQNNNYNSLKAQLVSGASTSNNQIHTIDYSICQWNQFRTKAYSYVINEIPLSVLDDWIKSIDLINYHAHTLGLLIIKSPSLLIRLSSKLKYLIN